MAWEAGGVSVLSAAGVQQGLWEEPGQAEGEGAQVAAVKTGH